MQPSFRPDYAAWFATRRAKTGALLADLDVLASAWLESTALIVVMSRSLVARHLLQRSFLNRSRSEMRSWRNLC